MPVSLYLLMYCLNVSTLRCPSRLCHKSAMLLSCMSVRWMLCARMNSSSVCCDSSCRYGSNVLSV